MDPLNHALRQLARQPQITPPTSALIDRLARIQRLRSIRAVLWAALGCNLGLIALSLAWPSARAIVLTPFTHATLAGTHLYQSALFVVTPWPLLGVLALLSLALIATRHLETLLHAAGKKDITRSSSLMRLAPHLTRATVTVGALALTVTGVTVYATSQPSPIQTAAAQLQRAVDAAGNTTYTIEGKTYVVDPTLTDADRRVQAVALQQATEKKLRQVLGKKAIVGGVAANQGTLIGTITAIQPNALSFDTGADYGGVYTVDLTTDTRYLKGDATVTLTDLHVGQGITVVFAIDPRTYTAPDPSSDKNPGIIRLQQAQKTAYAIAIVPYQVQDYLAALRDGGIQQQVAPGQPLQHESDGSAPLILQSPEE